MLNKCIIHFDMNRDNFLQIQNNFSKYSNKSNYTYINTQTNNFHLPNAFLQNNKKEILNFFKEIFERSSNKNFIISGQGIFQLSTDNLNSLSKFLSNYFKLVIFAGYTYTPKNYMEYLFQYKLLTTSSNFDIKSLYPNYKKKFSILDKVFGIENVLIWKYNDSNLQDNLLLDFFSRLNIHCDNNQIKKLNISQTNNYSRKAIALLYNYQKFYKNISYIENVRLLNYLTKIDEQLFSFAPTLIDNILQQNNQDIQWIEKRIGESFFEEKKYNKADISSQKDLKNIIFQSIDNLRLIIDQNILTDSKLYKFEYEIANLVHIIRMNLAYEKNNNKIYNFKKYDCFISLGNNCEVGLQLRKWGYDEGSFFRFTSCTADSLVTIIKNNFNDIFEYNNIIPSYSDTVRDTKYNIAFHSKMLSKTINRKRTFVIKEKDRKKIYSLEKNKINYFIDKWNKQIKNNNTILYFLKSKTPLQEKKLDQIVESIKQLGSENFDIVYLILPHWNIKTKNKHIIFEQLSKHAPGSNASDSDTRSYKILFSKYKVPTSANY